MHYLITTLEAADISRAPDALASSTPPCSRCRTYRPEPTTAEWWKIADPAQVRVHHQDGQGRSLHDRAGSSCRRQRYGCGRRTSPSTLASPSSAAFEFDALARYVLPQMVHARRSRRLLVAGVRGTKTASGCGRTPTKESIASPIAAELIYPHTRRNIVISR